MTSSPRSDGAPDTPLVLWEIQQTAKVAARRFEEAMKAADISTTEFGVLACVNDEPGITQADVARQLQVRPQALTATIDKLRRGKFISGAIIGRGRRSSLGLTDAGRAALDAAWPSVEALNAPGNLGMSHEQAGSLCRQLAELRTLLSAPAAPGGHAEPLDEP